MFRRWVVEQVAGAVLAEAAANPPIESKTRGGDPRSLPGASFISELDMETFFAVSSYWEGFFNYWKNAILKQSGFTMAVVGCGVLGIVIILAGRKKLDH